MLMLGQAHLSHPAKQDLAWAVGGGWAVSPAAHWVANMGSAKPGWWGAAAQTGAGGWPGRPNQAWTIWTGQTVRVQGRKHVENSCTTNKHVIWCVYVYI